MKPNLLNSIFTHIFHAMALRGSLTLAANDGEESALLANASDGGSPFAILQPDGFMIPYGEYPHKQGLQQFDRAAAEDMLAAHNSLLGRLARWARGDKASYPVYIGHPDLPGSKDADKRAYGWIEGMRPENDGLHLDVKWSPAGRELVENAHYKFYSPLWYFRKTKSGIRPVALKSMGLTNEPNIPVPALANESESETQDLETQDARREDESPTHEQTMNPELLAALGLEEGATLEQCVGKITALKQAADSKDEAETKATAAETAKSEAEAAKATAENELIVLKGEKVEIGRAVTKLECKLKLAANAAVQDAVGAGRVTPAEAESKLAELLAANDFEVALAGLGKLESKFKTTSQTGDLGGARSRIVVAANDESAVARQERSQLVANEFAGTNPSLSLGERKRIAWRRAQAKRPELFANRTDSSGAAA